LPSASLLIARKARLICNYLSQFSSMCGSSGN
jgi:hypothetical protein